MPLVKVTLMPTEPERPELTGRVGYIQEYKLERLRSIIRRRYNVREVFFRKQPVCPNCHRPFNPMETEAECKDFCCIACENGY